MFIRTERLFLRPGWPEDVDDIVALLGDEGAVFSVGFSAPKVTRSFLREFLARPRSVSSPHFLVYLRQPDWPVLIGGIALVAEGRHTRLSCWLARVHSGHGYAAEALKAALAEARMLGHHHVVAKVPDDSATVQGMLERAGFQPIGKPQHPEPAEGSSAVRLHMAVLADRFFDLLGVAPQRIAGPA